LGCPTSSRLCRAYVAPLTAAWSSGGDSRSAPSTKRALRVGGSVGFPDDLCRRGSHRRGLGCGGLVGTSVRTLTLVAHLGLIDGKRRPTDPRSRHHDSGGVAGVGRGTGHLGQSPLLAFRSLRLREPSCLRDVASIVGGGCLDAGRIRALACGGARRPRVAGVRNNIKGISCWAPDPGAGRGVEATVL